VKVVDSSGEKYPFIELPPHIQYFHLPGYRVYEKIKFVLAQSKAKYIMLIADDDIVFESSIRHGIGYLEANSECSLAQGEWISFSDYSLFLTHCPGFNSDVHMADRALPDYLEDDAAIRCRNFLSNYPMTFWALYRKDIFFKICKMLDELNIYYYRMNEIIHEALACYYGKIKFMDCVLVARENRLMVDSTGCAGERNDNRDSARGALLVTMTTANTYEVFSEKFNKITARLDGMVIKGFTKLVFDSYNIFFNKLYQK